MIMCMIPISAGSSDIIISSDFQSQDKGDDFDVLMQSTENIDTQETMVKEIIARREANVKLFQLPDGTVQAVVYVNAVHRKNAEGVWQDINNNLSADNAKVSDAYVTDDLRMIFTKSFSANQQIFTLNENRYNIHRRALYDKS